MTADSSEQRNAYKGAPLRPWIRVRLLAVDGSFRELDLLADTGNPCALIIGEAVMAKLATGQAPDVQTNFGTLVGGWLQVDMPEVGIAQHLIAYSSDVVVSAAKASSPDFEGLAGLPFLRLLEYGGNADFFWIRKAPSAENL